ncbi:MAG: hypothetical protein ACI8RZ_003802 [Myxococcota bacterium]|jgi:hypothetical protein
MRLNALCLFAATAATAQTADAASTTVDASKCSRTSRLMNTPMTIGSLHDGRVLSTLHNSGDPSHIGNQERIIVYDSYGDATQQWTLVPLGDGFVKIINSHDGRALSTLHNSDDSNHKGNQEELIVYDYYGDATQKWCVENRGGYSVLISAFDGRAVSTLHNSGDPSHIGNQERIIVYDSYGDATQNWRFKPLSAPTSRAKVTIYRDARYEGPSMELRPGSHDMSALTIGNDQVSSVKVPAGFTVTLYEHANYQGRAVTLTADNTYLSDFNDQVSSIKVSRQ